MTPEEVGERMVALLTADDADAPVDPSALTTSVSGGGPGHERAVLDVPPALWWTALRAARDPGALGCDYFDWLSAVDELDEGFTVVAHLWSTRRKHGLLVRARVPRENPLVESVVDLYPGAAWHERETHEMFGIGFDRHPGLRPLLLPPEFEGHPLRKEFVLASRVAKAWPGAKEPGESEAGVAKRAPMRPPGVPDPNEWGPLKGKVPPPETPARRAPGDRPARPAGDGPARPAGERPARLAGERPAHPAGDHPARPAGDRPAGPARPAPGDRPVRDIADRATPGTPGDPKAETTPPAPAAGPEAEIPVPPAPPSTPAHAAGAANAAEAADAADAAAAANADAAPDTAPAPDAAPARNADEDDEGTR
ncbi:NADH-quinone oxidoreductase subunit C [Nucisporomicrobium flavum]|uniref:NADH-quinone oxidoreductase subunit C n=1 Tax=Nucisporomicrobium flavum TaxID=2785915 RepID=UPI003C3019E3